MRQTPTCPDRRLPAPAPTLTTALDAAARGDTGINLHGLRGERTLALPYARLRELALALAGRLRAAGLAPGDRLGLAAETDADFVLAFFAAVYAGLIPAPMPLPAPLGGPQAYVDAVARLLAGCGAVAAFGPAGLRPMLAEATARAGARLLPPLDELPPADPAWAVAGTGPGPDDAAYLQFSSGSTREPTGVLVTHRALAANALAITRHGLRIEPADRAVSWLPLFHDMGLVGFLLSPVFAGMSVDLLPTDAFVRRPLLWPRLISETGGTVAYSPTFGYELCARRAQSADLSDLDLSRWRIAGIGGDRVRAGPLAQFAERFAPAGFSDRAFLASYGMAEATLALTMAEPGTGLACESLGAQALEAGRAEAPAPGLPALDFARCGRVLPGHELEVRDAAGASLPERRIGRVFARGPSLMQGYFDQPEATAAVLSPDGWLDTGDLGFLADGELTPTGRAKDMILLNGRNIWPQDLEWTAETETAGVRRGDVAAFSLAGADEDVVVLVQTRTRDADARERLAAEVAALLRSRHGVEARVRLVGAGALPHTSSGKLRRAEARKLYLSGAFEPA